MIVGRIVYEDAVPHDEMLGRTVKLRKHKFKRIVKHFSKELKCLEEKNYIGKEDRKSEIAEVKMKLNIV